MQEASLWVAKELIIIPENMGYIPRRVSWRRGPGKRHGDTGDDE